MGQIAFRENEISVWVIGSGKRSGYNRLIRYGKGRRGMYLETSRLILRDYEERGGEGGTELASKVLKTLEEKESRFEVLYEDTLSLQEKIETIASRIYGAGGVTYTAAAVKQLQNLEKLGFGNLPVCMAKTQYSLSDDPALLGRPVGFSVNVREAYVSAGAGFVVVLTGAVMTMPGLPKRPAACQIDVDENGKITGLF